MNTLINIVVTALASFFVPNQLPASTISPTPTIEVSSTPVKKMQFKDEIERWPYKVRYVIWVPENGGTTEGKMRGYGFGISDDCSADFNGNYDGQEGGKIQGNIKGQCETPLLGGKITGTLEGKVYRKKRYMQSWLKGKIGEIEFNEYLYSPEF